MSITSDNRPDAPNPGVSTGILGLTVYIGLKIPNLSSREQIAFVILPARYGRGQEAASRYGHKVLYGQS